MGRFDFLPTAIWCRGLTFHILSMQAMAMVPQRDKALQEELNKQNSNDTLRATFATQANAVGAYIQAKMEVSAAVNVQLLNQSVGCRSNNQNQTRRHRAQLGRNFNGFALAGNWQDIHRDERHSGGPADPPEGVPADHHVLHA